MQTYYQFKMGRLLLAMAAHEGWAPLGSAIAPEGSNSYRHNNPGNMRTSPFECGNVNGFSVFMNEAIGWNAFQYDIIQKAKGNTHTGLGPTSTLRDLIMVWAPPSDNNDVDAYVARVLLLSGLPATTTLAELLEQ